MDALLGSSRRYRLKEEEEEESGDTGIETLVTTVPPAGSLGAVVSFTSGPFLHFLSPTDASFPTFHIAAQC